MTARTTRITLSGTRRRVDLAADATTAVGLLVPDDRMAVLRENLRLPVRTDVHLHLPSELEGRLPADEAGRLDVPSVHEGELPGSGVGAPTLHGDGVPIVPPTGSLVPLHEP